MTQNLNDVLNLPLPKSLVADSIDLQEKTSGVGEYRKLTDKKSIDLLGVTFFAKRQAFVPTKENSLTHKTGTYFTSPDLNQLYTQIGITATGILYRLLISMEYYNYVIVGSTTAKDFDVSVRVLNQSIKTLVSVDLLMQYKPKLKELKGIKQYYYDTYGKPLPLRTRIFKLNINVGYRGQVRLETDRPKGFYVKNRISKYEKFLWKYGHRTVIEGLLELSHRGKYVVDKLTELWKVWDKEN